MQRKTKSSDGEKQLEGGMRRKRIRGGCLWGGWRIICFSPSPLLYDTRKSDSYHNGGMNHSRN